MISMNSLILQYSEYNPRYFEEPEKYKPARWYGDGATEPEAEFSAFSIGLSS
jgi:hypothetical protein